ncbi:unnamed protein product [marine sediment metagenome]|uniref:Uncharacterized protein n=1 Tax=marine sediment metagenome TaxID=412755 RepID=X0TJY4_9ZZZZ
MWDSITIIGLTAILCAAVFGPPIFLLRNYLTKQAPKNYPYRKPSMFVDSFGHIQKVEPEKSMEVETSKYFKDHPKEAKEFIDGLHDEEVW